MLRRYRNWPFVSATLVVINVIVFCLCIFTGEMLYYKGGVERFAILEQQEYGRLIWAMFLHSDTAHLFNNMIILFFLGAMLEKEIGHVWLTIIYFLSGLGGNIVSLARKVMTGSDSLSVGASGAVFGLDGLLLALVIFSQDFRNSVSPGRVVLMIALSLYDGFMGSNIDNAAHVGGLIVGFLAGTVIVLARDIRNKKYRREVQF
ncbi:MAG: rhomboid family intramembrane serine protease [Acetatifactor sp.]|nr:rhomboid family intramembrane serine protease [Acetatifactor sp.]MDE6700149.1 rhomboid family intramembrane serine protease [Acetatifactor sp.]